jgi:hypothetical protein
MQILSLSACGTMNGDGFVCICFGRKLISKNETIERMILPTKESLSLKEIRSAFSGISFDV